MSQLYKRIYSFFKSGSTRSLKAKKNIILSIFVKGASIGITFMLVPLMINYLNKEQYGIWVTIGSVVGWANLFDFGLGHGLRNRLAEAMAENDKNKAKIFVSTTYALTAIIIGTVYIIYFISQLFINWSTVFNVPDTMESELANVMLIIFSFFSLQFIIKLIYNILLADQSPGIVDLLRLIAKIISFAVIYILIQYTTGSLTKVALVFGSSPLLIMLVTSSILYKKRYKAIRPSIHAVKFHYTKNIMNLGLQFFIMQLAAVIMFSTDNIIVTQLFGPENVTVYDIAYKYFGGLTMLFSIIVSPMWSATTEAYVKGDFKWIVNIERKFKLTWLLLTLLAVIMVLISKIVYAFWVGKSIQIPLLLSIGMALYVVLYMYGSIYVNIINGTGKVRLQFYTAIIAATINIPLSIFLGKHLGLGLAGVILATSLSNFYGPIFAPIQYFKLINKKAKGIWNK